MRAVTRAGASHQPYRMRHDRLVDWVIQRLEKGWSPQEISGRLAVEFPNDAAMRASTEIIYAWIYDPARRHRQLWQYLPRGHKKGRRVHSERIRWRTSIHARPAEVEDRLQFGHWESDSVLGVRGTGALHTTVERVSRFLHAATLPGPTAQATLDGQLSFYRQLSVQAVAFVTADNGSEFAFHHRLADTIGVPTYFADPYSAWQRHERTLQRKDPQIPAHGLQLHQPRPGRAERDHRRDQRPTPQDPRLGPSAEVFGELCSMQATPTCCTST